MHRRKINWITKIRLLTISSLAVLVFAAGATTVTVETPLGSFEIELLDQQAPLNVANFLNYVNDGDYENSFFHRSIPGFIIQSGAFVFDNDTASSIAVNPPVVNEFGLSNTRGTVAMAKLGGDPDSASSSWFVNLADNSGNLDDQNGGFTVFGQVIGDGMDVVDQIAALPRFNFGSPFTDLPLVDYSSGDVTAEHFVYSSVSVKPSGEDLLIDASFSGAWYDPSHEGEGFLIEILTTDVALIYWFTYDPDGNQAWVAGIGQINGNRIDVTDALRPIGARFGAAFDPADVDTTLWGDFSIEFTTCDTADLTYTGIWGDDGQSLQRIWSIDGIPCDQNPSKVLNGSMTGAWFDPDRVGEGFLIDVVAPDTAVVYWFTYDTQGNQAWIFGIGRIEGGRITELEAFTTSGGLFGPDFDPATVQDSAWGPMAFSFAADGNSATMRYQGIEPFGDGTNFLVRLSQLAATQVTFDQPALQVSTRGIAANNLVLDGDVNDPNTPERSNDSSETSQSVPNPVVISGFATRVTMESGRFSADTDEFDSYRITLAAGQAVFLEVADHQAGDPAAVDLDLFLFAIADGLLAASSESISEREEILVPADGEYDLVVRAVAGASNYRMTVGSPAGAVAAKSARTESEWVIGEAIITLSMAAKSAADQSLATLKALGLKLKAGAPDRELLVLLDQYKSKDAAAREQAVFQQRGWSIGASARRAQLLAIKSLNQLPEVAIAEPNYRRWMLTTPNDSAFEAQWHYPNIRLPQAWEIETGSQSVVVAVLDTGVSAHPDNLDNLNMSLGADLISDLFTAGDDDGVDFDASDPGDQSQPGQSSFHGTHVAGTIGASTNNDIGGAGVAWAVTIMPVRVLGQGGGTSFDIIQGLRWAAGLSNATGSTPAINADVINLSLGGGGFSMQEQSLYNEIRDLGIVVVAAAGNDGTDAPSYPASYDNVLSVSASTIQDLLADYSQFGSSIDVAAPGGETATDFNGDGLPDGVLSNLFQGLTPDQPILSFLAGTSMATPHLAGVVALMKSQFPEMTPDQLDNALSTGQITKDVAGDGAAVRNDSFGFGRIDALKAVQWARMMAGGGAVSTPILAPSSSLLSFGSNLDTQSLSLSNAGAGALSIAGTRTDQAWLSVVPVTVDGNGLGSYSISVDRSGLVKSRHSGSVFFDGSDDSTVQVAITMDVGSVEVPGTAGTIYVLFIDPLIGQAALQLALPPGTHYEISAELLAGEYYIIAGTDNDNDFFICDAGEMCGAYPTLSDISIFDLLEQDLNLGDFIINAPSSLGSLSNGAKSTAKGAEVKGPRAYRRLQ